MMNQVQYAQHIGMSKQYVNKMVKAGVIPLHDKKIDPTEADQCLADHADPSYDAQREANNKAREKESLFHDDNVPEESLATMSPDELKKYNEDMEKKLAALGHTAGDEGIKDIPKLVGSAAEWNVFKIKEMGLLTALKRKEKARMLIPVDEAKAVIERFLSPVNQKMNDLPFTLKSQFPQIDDEVIEWLLDHINSIKLDVQNEVI